MDFVVKNTTRMGLLDLLCPHTCRGCGHLGEVLCERCKNDIKVADSVICPMCKNIVAEKSKNVEKVVKCKDCDLTFDWIGVVGWREGALKKLVADFKYHAVRAAGDVLVELMDNRIPENLEKLIGVDEVVVVPLPTIGKHARERGLDHTAALVKKLAKRRGWKVRRMLGRKLDTVQVGSKVADRKVQAEKAYEVLSRVDDGVAYLLVDDVWTTGATMLAAEKTLRQAGAKKVGGVVIAVSKLN